MYWYYVILIVLFAGMYFITIRPQNKKEKELKALRDSLEIGDEIMTIGGIYGTVVRVKEEKITIASGAEKSKIEINRSAVSTVFNKTADTVKKADTKEEEAKKPSPKNVKKLSKKEEEAETEEGTNEHLN